MTKFILIRHAVTDHVNKRLSGRMNGVHLNEEGRMQAKNLAERLSDFPIAAIYSSPLERTLETAEPIARSLHLQTIPQDDFIEIDFGEWTNCSIEELTKNSQFQLFNTFRSCTPIPGGETMQQAQVRIISGLRKLCIQHPQETVIVISHSDLIKSAIAHYAGIHLDLFHRIEISPASISIVDVYDETARISLMNCTGEIKIQ